MKYNSTRGECQGRTFEQALFSGYAEDGGIFMPEAIPKLATEDISDLSGFSYKDIAKKIIPLFIDETEIPTEKIDDIIERGYRKIRHPDVTPIRRLSNGLNLQEQFHGPTMAFKDLALGVVGLFLDYFSEKRKQHRIALVATSGDTGSAAIEAVRGSRWIDIIVYLPTNRCSKLQELWMTTAIDDNVHVYRVDGTSDDLDQPIKCCFEDTDFTKKHGLLSVNSINWARIMMQIVSYFYGYLQMCPGCDKELEIVVPTGACGNITAGIIAREMGLPIRFVCAVTRNDIVARTVLSGDYSMAESVLPSLAPAMDIQSPYNMERIWYVMLNGDTELIKQMCHEFESNKRVQIPENLSQKVKAIVDAYVVTDDEIKRTMRRCWEENQYILDPHTSIAAHYHYEHKQASGDVPRLCVSTASPAKFPETVERAGLSPEANELADRILELPTRSTDVGRDDDWLRVLKDKIIQITERNATE